MIRRGVLVDDVAFPSSRRLQCRAGGGAATGQARGRRDPLWEKEQTADNDTGWKKISFNLKEKN